MSEDAQELTPTEGQQPEQQSTVPLTPEQAKLLEPNENSVFGLLMHSDEELDKLIAQRAADQTGRFDYCRDLGSKIAEARQARNMTLEQVAIDSGVSSRYLDLIEHGALDWNFVSDEIIELLNHTLGVSLPYYEETTTN